MFSSRTAIPEATNWYTARWARAAEESPLFIDLTQSNPTRVGLPYDELRLRHAVANADWLTYRPESRGATSARERLARHFAVSGVHRAGRVPDPEHLVLTASTSEAYGYLFKVLCDPGDSVLVPEPSYPLFEELARYDCVQLLPYRLLYDGAWHIDFDSLRRARRADTRAVLVVSPNNPTGSCLNASQLTALHELGLPLIADEVFADFCAHPAAESCSAWSSSDRGLVFILDGLSKWAGLPQCKLAWTVVAGEPAQRDNALRRLEFVADAYLSPNGFTQAAIGELLEAGRVTNRALKQRLAVNLMRLDHSVTGSVVTRLHYEGGWSAVLRLPAVLDEQAWLERCFAAGVGVQPGWFFDFGFSPVVILSLLPEPAVFQAGVERLIALVELACR
jgi:alanine-synthesizing transaminase